VKKGEKVVELNLGYWGLFGGGGGVIGGIVYKTM